jgi:hypothetical protein
LAAEIEKLREKEVETRVAIEAVGDMVGVGVEEVNGHVGELAKLVRLINKGEKEVMDDECF